MAAHQAPPSLGFSRQEYWSGLPFPSPMHKVKSQSEVAQSCPTLSDPVDCSLPGSSVHGIFQARVLEWGAIALTSVLFGKTMCTNKWLHFFSKTFSSNKVYHETILDTGVQMEVLCAKLGRCHWRTLPDCKRCPFVFFHISHLAVENESMAVRALTVFRTLSGLEYGNNLRGCWNREV